MADNNNDSSMSTSEAGRMGAEAQPRAAKVKGGKIGGQKSHGGGRSSSSSSSDSDNG